MTENQPRVCLCLFYRPPTGLKKWRTSSSLHLLGKSVSLSRLPFHYRFVAQYITHARINSREIHKTAMHHRHTHIHDLDTLAHCFLMALQSSIPGLMPETFSSFIAVFFLLFIYMYKFHGKGASSISSAFCWSILTMPSGFLAPFTHSQSCVLTLLAAPVWLLLW